MDLEKETGDEPKSTTSELVLETHVETLKFSQLHKGFNCLVRKQI